MSWRGLLISWAIVAAVAFGAGARFAEPAPASPRVAPATTIPLQEDDPGWDCHTMGNRVCGPGAG